MKIDPNLDPSASLQQTTADRTKNQVVRPSSEEVRESGFETDPTEGDTFQPSAMLAQAQVLAARVQQMPDVRTQRVAALKQQIEQGTYNPSNEAVANAVMVSMTSSTRRS